MNGTVYWQTVATLSLQLTVLEKLLKFYTLILER